MILRYGLDNSKPLTLDEIGSRFNIGKERIRQVEARALYKIRRNKTLKDEHFFL